MLDRIRRRAALRALSLRSMICAPLCLLLAACGGGLAADGMTSPREARLSGCATNVAQPFYEGRNGTYVLVAESFGPECATADLDAMLMDPQGVPVWVLRIRADQMFLSQDVNNRTEMRAALREWIAPPSTSYARTADLSPWRRGAQQPGAPGAEFPFLPADGMTRTRYEGVRAQNMPLLCLVQGLESLDCNALDGRRSGAARVIPLGIQVFPG